MPPCTKCIEEDRASCPECSEDTIQASQGGGEVLCLCGSGSRPRTIMSCTSCDRKWHSACVGLEGLTQSITNKIVSWKCPLCFRFSQEIRGKIDEGDLEESEVGGSDVGCGVKEEVTKQIGDCIPEIVEKVMGGVRAALSDPEAFKDASQKITQNWADLAKKEQKTMINDVVEKTSETALKKSISLIDANLTEQRKRVRNCVISNIAEDYNRGRETEASLGDVVVEVLNEENLTLNDLVSCKRLGERKPNQNRFVLVVFKSEQDAMYFHNYGRGRKLGQGVWVNPDLTKTERDNLWAKRQERKRRRNRNSGGEDERNDVNQRERDGGAGSPARPQRRNQTPTRHNQPRPRAASTGSPIPLPIPSNTG